MFAGASTVTVLDISPLVENSAAVCEFTCPGIPKLDEESRSAMSGAAQHHRCGSEVVFERIAEAIEGERRRALIEHAFAEQAWHSPGYAVADRARAESGHRAA
ncbi:hypothetical protein [Mycolicibacterium septicum]|uniref:hypothetical protein n=1 Tax=Mycolicibacterium septicum TaxID=98668 RepID=UPI001AF5D5EE|nr:hypothetical protein [Mycolicibacterium septicum]QRY54261.1 hypothetical protein JVX95_13630 [Mycolicibacterium septicum]